MYIGLYVNYPLVLPDFSETWIFTTDFRKTLKHRILWKSGRLEVELFHADRRTDRHDEASSRFSQFLRTRL